MLNFKEIRDAIQQRYHLDAATANQTAKMIIEDAEDSGHKFYISSDLTDWLEYVESLGE